jgi:hypothetical protein
LFLSGLTPLLQWRSQTGNTTPGKSRALEAAVTRWTQADSVASASLRVLLGRIAAAVFARSGW